jgi:hypothetical protein
VLFLVFANAAEAAPYQCPPPLAPSALGCTFRSAGGTTTFTATVSAQAMGRAVDGALLAMEINLDSQPCFSNLNSPTTFRPTVDPTVITGASVNGTCTFDVSSKRPVELTGVSQVFNATQTSISIGASSIAFVPDFHLDVAATGNGSGTIDSSDGGIHCGSDCSESYSPATTITLTAQPAPGSRFTGWGGSCSGDSTCILRMNETKAVTANFVMDEPPSVIEFYNARLDHYFITASPAEAAAIDAGNAGPDWSRTGYSFRPGGSTPVCRFYGSPSPGPNSHFYSALAGECDALKALQALTPSSLPRWNFEGYAFATTLPVGGACPTYTVPVYRAYNNGFALGKDSNHRITTNPYALQEVIAKGWRFEGVVMCAP